MRREFGLFNDEGLVEGGFDSTQGARKALETRYSPDDGVFIQECCPYHPEQRRYLCEECEDTSEGDDL